MKRLITLIILIIVSFKSFSQTDTTKILLEEQIARLVIKDLIDGDGAKEELAITQEKVLLLNQKLALKDSIIENKVLQLNIKDVVLDKRGTQIQLTKEVMDELEEDLQKQETKTKLAIIGTIIVLVITTIF